MKDKILYLSSVDLSRDSGVKIKLDEFISHCISLGHNTLHYNYYIKSTLKKARFFTGKILHTKAKKIYIRSLGNLHLSLFPAFVIARLSGKKIYLEFPTPRVAALKEVTSNKTRLKKITYSIRHYMNGPWILLPVHRVIHYGNESPYFLFGSKHKTIIIGNSIDPNRVTQRKRSSRLNDEDIYALGVANLTLSQGYDRFIRMLKQWNENSNNPRLYFTIVGDGNELENLKQLVKKLNVENNVTFTGRLQSDKLYEMYDNHHIGIGSLGLFRKKLTLSSSLKIREYCLAGLPFMASGKDPDFPKDCAFRWLVKNEDETNSISMALTQFIRLKDSVSDNNIRSYALENLSFEKNLKKIGLTD